MREITSTEGLVFCAKCRHLDYHTGDSSIWHCNHPKEIKAFADAIFVDKKTQTLAIEKNKDNDCKDFEQREAFKIQIKPTKRFKWFNLHG